MTIFKWEIENMHNVFRSFPIVSPPFHIEPSRTFKFCLQLYPFGWNSLKEMILVLWRCDSNERTIELKYNLQIEGTGNHDVARNGIFTYNFKTPMQFPEKSVYLHKPISDCLPLLKMSCKINYIFEDIDKEVMRDLTSNYESLQEDHTFSDLQFNFGNTDFYFHRAILEARCDKLAEQLRTLPYVDPTILKSVAQFLYSGKFTTWKTKIIPNLVEKFGSSLHESMYPFIISEYSAKTLIEENCCIFDWVIDDYNKDGMFNDRFTYMITEGGTYIQLSFYPFREYNLPNFNIEMSEYGRFIRCRVDIQVGDMYIPLVEMSNTEANPSLLEINQVRSMKNVILNSYPFCTTKDTIKFKIYIYLSSSNYTSKVDAICYTNIYKDDMYMYNLREDFKRLFHHSQYYDFVIIVNYNMFHEDYERHHANYARFHADYSAFDEDYEKIHAEFMRLNAHYYRFQVHKAILSVRSPVFRALCSHDFIDARNNETTITDIKPYVLRIMLLFMYCGQMSPLNMDLALDLNAAADKYRIEMLVKKCSDFLEFNIEADTVDIIQEHANSRNMQQLEAACVRFRTRNINIIG